MTPASTAGVMDTWKEYILAESLADALQALAEAPGPARLVAGGTDLLLELQQGRHEPVHTLVDITRVPELGRLELRGERLFIGAAVPVRVVTGSPLVRQHAQAVAEACGLIGGPQVRNTATLGGNVAHALPAADGMIALVALDAQVEIASRAGCRLQPILSIFRGLGQSTLDPQAEILTGFYLPVCQKAQASAFGRVMRPQGVALPILNMAVWLERSGAHIQNIRIVVGPSGAVPQRATALEDCLTPAMLAGVKGARWDAQTLAQVRSLARTSLRLRTSPQRATAEYRYRLCEVLLEEVITKAWNRAESQT